MGYTCLIAGIVFLCNPIVNIVDILPDCIGYFLILLGIEKLAYADKKMAAFREKIRFLMFLTLPKVLLSIFSIGGSSHFEFLGDSTMVLVYAFCYAVAEPIFMWQAFDLFFDGLYRIGIKENDATSAVLYEQKKGKTLRAGDRMLRLTHWFIVVRAVLSVLPQFIFIADLSYLEYDIYGVYMDVRDAFPVLLAVSVILMLPLSVTWCVRFCRYLKRIYKEATLQKNTEGALKLLGENYTLARQRNTFRDGFLVLFCGAVLFFHLNIGGYNILPRFAGVLLIFLALFVIRQDMTPKKSLWIFGGIAVPLGITTYTVSVISASKNFSAVFASTFSGWGADAAQMISENPITFLRYLGFYLDTEDAAAWDFQLIVFLLTAVEVVFLCLFMRSLLDMMRCYVKDGGEALLRRFSFASGLDIKKAEKKLERRPKQIFGTFIVTMILTVFGEHPVCVYYLTPIPALRTIAGLVFLYLLADYMRQLYRSSAN